MAVFSTHYFNPNLLSDFFVTRSTFYWLSEINQTSLLDCVAMATQDGVWSRSRDEVLDWFYNDFRLKKRTDRFIRFKNSSSSVSESSSSQYGNAMVFCDVCLDINQKVVFYGNNSCKCSLFLMFEYYNSVILAWDFKKCMRFAFYMILG